MYSAPSAGVTARSSLGKPFAMSGFFATPARVVMRAQKTADDATEKAKRLSVRADAHVRQKEAEFQNAMERLQKAARTPGVLDAFLEGLAMAAQSKQEALDNARQVAETAQRDYDLVMRQGATLARTGAQAAMQSSKSSLLDAVRAVDLASGSDEARFTDFRLQRLQEKDASSSSGEGGPHGPLRPVTDARRERARELIQSARGDFPAAAAPPPPAPPAPPKSGGSLAELLQRLPAPALAPALAPAAREPRQR